MKYSINSSGYIVAERDIYSLGGFIPKGSVGCKVANGDQISQDGECWVASGDMSANPWVKVSGNTYVGRYNTTLITAKTNPVNIMGDTLIPGTITVQHTADLPISDGVIRDSFIGVSIDALCGPASTATAFPFEQGGFNKDVPAGTLFTSASMHTGDANICRTTANLRLGKDTYLYIPTGYNCRVLWGYWNTSGQLAYSGESFAVSQALTKLEHPTYKLAMIHISKANGTAMTPTDLLSTGAKVLGHSSGSVITALKMLSTSGVYVMDKSSLIVKTNWSYGSVPLRQLAGRMINTNCITEDRVDLKIFGTFSNVNRLEYSWYVADSQLSHPKRDTFVTASDCPLLRVDSTFLSSQLAFTAGNLTLRRCVVPKGVFGDNEIEGNTYEDIDFSYANEHLNATVGAGTSCISSHKQGLYAASSNNRIYGYVSKPDNLIGSANMGPDEESLPLDGSMIERGAYVSLIGSSYEDAKQVNIKRLRTVRPIRCKGASLPVLSGTWKITSVLYLDENMNIASEPLSGTLPIDETKPFIVFNFGTTNDSEVYVQDFVELNYFIRSYNYGKVPEVTGSAFIGAGATVRGDVKLIGDPYVNRILDRNLWERKALSGDFSKGWEAAKIERVAGDRMLTIDLQEIGNRGCTITCESGYYFIAYLFDGEGTYMLNPGWQQSYTVSSTSLARYVGILIKKAAASADNGGLITEDDIPLANVKIVQAFKKRRYITNEIDRTSPEDVFLSQDAWRVSAISTGIAYIGRTYDSLIQASSNWCILKRPINAGASWTVTLGNAVTYAQSNSSWDASTKLLGLGVRDSAALTGLELKKVDSAIVTLLDVPAGRFVVEFVPQPRIIALYDSPSIEIVNTKIRMYDNSVLSKTLRDGGTVVLRGDAVARYDYTVGCMCSNGHSDALIKLP